MKKLKTQIKFLLSSCSGAHLDGLFGGLFNKPEEERVHPLLRILVPEKNGAGDQQADRCNVCSEADIPTGCQGSPIEKG